MRHAEHSALADALQNVDGKVALSSYESELMDALYSDWNRIEAPVKMCHSSKAPRREVLWTNYPADVLESSPIGG
ncbi:MAG: hypothetical protein OXM61_00495 [Candidatus Poribacteria bacterium]|nr:hypothetical protein [Candidatus Poribacteria bacterium]